jgi:hypothetical protein
LRKAIGGAGGEPDADEADAEDGEEEEGDGEGDSGFTDATPTLEEMAKHIGALEENQELVAKSLAEVLEQGARSEAMQKSIGEGLLAVMERTERIAASPEPRKGAVTALEEAMAKAMGGGASADGAGAARRHRQFTREDFEQAKEILSKAVADKKLTLPELCHAETQIQKSMLFPAFQIDRKFLDILVAGDK